MSKKTVINIGLCGFGTVGQGVWKHLSRTRAELESRLGVGLEIRSIAVRNPRRKRTVKIPDRKLPADALAIGMAHLQASDPLKAKLLDRRLV